MWDSEGVEERHDVVVEELFQGLDGDDSDSETKKPKRKKLVARTKKTRNVHVRAAMTQRRPSPRAHLMMMSLLRRKPAYMTVVKCKAHHHMHAWCNHDMMYVAVFTSGIICFSCLS